MAQHLFFLTKPVTRKKETTHHTTKCLGKVVDCFKQPLTQVQNQLQNNMLTSFVPDKTRCKSSHTSNHHKQYFKKTCNNQCFQDLVTTNKKKKEKEK